jgi:hypothetical protein
MLKVRTYPLFLFSKRTHWPKSLSCLEFGDVVITRRLSLAEYYYTEPFLYKLLSGDVVWLGEILPIWELEWVDDDE